MSVQSSLFDGLQSSSSEGIKYAGSKLKLIPSILKLARKVEATTVFDGFAGTTRVSQAFASSGWRVICNDHAVWSEVFGQCYLRSKKPPREYEELIDHLNSVPPRSGWFTEHYGGLARRSGENRTEKRPWQVHNTQKLDAIREEIDTLDLDRDAECVALTSLILALDQVDNTLGHFAAYLREWSPRSHNSMKLQLPAIIQTGVDHEVFRSDIFNLLPRVEADLAYYDPPYGSNNEKMPPSRVRYASYYHVWTTVCLNDRPSLFGRVNRRLDTSDTIANSPFEDFRKSARDQFVAVEAIRRLLTESRSRHVILSYSSGGRATAEELNDVMGSWGDLLETVEVDYRRNVMAGMRWTNEWLRDAEEPNREFLFLLRRRS